MLQQSQTHNDDHDLLAHLIEKERDHFAALWAVFRHSVERARQNPQNSTAVHDVVRELDELVGLYNLIGTDSALFAIGGRLTLVLNVARVWDEDPEGAVERLMEIV